MKKSMILTLALGLFLFSCQKSDTLTDPRSSASATRVAPAAAGCTSYSIFNPHAPTGPAIEYSYIDCNGVLQTGWVNPRETIIVVAQPGTVKCPGGVVTEMGTNPTIAPK